MRAYPTETLEDPSAPSRPELPDGVVEELAAAVGRAAALEVAVKLARAAEAYGRDRYADSLRMARQVRRLAPGAVAPRELCGLACYRLGRWKDAIRYLEPLWRESGDVDQVPVLMDCHRALRERLGVELLWAELVKASPPADVLVEGRLVYAAFLADEGRLGEAISLLSRAGAARRLRHPAERHLRQWYVLADLYDRAGDTTRAREVFGWLASDAPDMADVRDRLADLGARGRRARHGRRGRPAGEQR